MKPIRHAFMVASAIAGLFLCSGQAQDSPTLHSAKDVVDPVPRLESRMSLNMGLQELGLYLDFYSHASRKSLVVASNVRLGTMINLGTIDEDTATCLAAMRGLLLKKAGIVLNDIDDKRVSVTFNDRLDIAASERKRLGP